ncbi:MAG: hypothetical protein MUF15_04420 [Acidobacteria bacterium]|jgi:hypothetical protein|nr:hypothetical protein [Acidobacteriota bacterium]
MKKSNILNLFVVIVILTGTVFIPGCKKSEEADEFVLTVQLSNGAVGTPGNGVHTHKKNEIVSYNYTLKDAYQNLKVTMDGETVQNTGTVTMSANHTLYITADAKTGTFLLTVSLGSGVDGTPTAGTTYYLPNAQVPYSYTLKENYMDLKITLDGVIIPNSGVITILKDSTLSATATLHYDIRGSWALTESYADGSAFSGTLTFAGTSQAGTVSESDGGIGTYTVTGTYITITVLYPNVSYTYTGLFSDKDNISGTSKRTITATGTVSGGSWKGKRNASTSTLFSGLFSNKGE